MSEPDTTEPADVPVMIEMTREEFDAALKAAEERGKNGSWAAARKHYKSKTVTPEDLAQLTERVGVVEKLLALAFAQSNRKGTR